jgi:hypothetical protein
LQIRVQRHRQATLVARPPRGWFLARSVKVGGTLRHLPPFNGCTLL